MKHYFGQIYQSWLGTSLDQWFAPWIYEQSLTSTRQANQLIIISLLHSYWIQHSSRTGNDPGQTKIVTTKQIKVSQSNTWVRNTNHWEEWAVNYVFFCPRLINILSIQKLFEFFWWTCLFWFGNKPWYDFYCDPEYINTVSIYNQLEVA